ncbi:MAG TPA: hypothetical protein VF173_13305 [Thermoanaerobaculia bacterium]|nr:hypothetical protein [Thermoanaerobaculia bacterium]
MNTSVKTVKKRSAATVALDLSLAGQAAAVALDGRRRIVAWTVASEGGNAGGLAGFARQALRDLQVRPREVRVLLGAGTGAGDEAQVAVLDHPGTPDEGEILAALFADGYPRLSEPSVAAAATSPGTWLVAACGASTIEPLAAGLLEESGTEPAFVVDQLLAEEESEDLEDHGEPLPAACELAWRLAQRSSVTRLASPRSERRRASLTWARRATHVAMFLAVLGVLAMAAGLRLAWGSRARTQAFASQAAGDARLVQELREIGALVEEAKRLRTDLAGRTAPWPRVAGTVAALARIVPPETGWERLQIKEGALELEASATGATPEARLDLLRQALERSPELANLSWGAPGTDRKNPRLHQVFRAAVREAPAAASQGAP